MSSSMSSPVTFDFGFLIFRRKLFVLLEFEGEECWRVLLLEQASRRGVSRFKESIKDDPIRGFLSKPSLLALRW
jgi:hypothetical protein